MSMNVWQYYMEEKYRKCQVTFCCCCEAECTVLLTVAVRIDGVEGALVVDDQYVSIFYCSAGTLRLSEFIPLPHKVRPSCGLLRSFHGSEKY